MTKSIIGIDWPVIDLFLDFPDKLRKNMLSTRDGTPHFMDLTGVMLAGYAENYTGQTIPGGTMTNMLATAAALGGVKASLIGVTGFDNTGNTIRRNLAKRQIELLYEPQPDDKSAVMYALKSAGGETYYNPSAGTARTGLSAVAIDEKITDPANTIMAMQHGFMAHPDIAPDTRNTIIAKRNQGAKLALGLQDIQYTRPGSLINNADYIFGNRAEFKALTNANDKAGIIDALLNDFAQGSTTCIMTDGEHGLMAIRNSRIIADIPAAPIEPADIKCTVGAGDAVMGGFLHASAAGWNAQAALNLAALCAREALKQDGGQPARTEPGHLRYLLAQAVPGC